MSEHAQNPLRTRQWIIPMRPRSPAEEHRSATPLELFFDLVFVVAVAQASSSLHHGIAEAHTADSVLPYVMVFFAIWWAWMNFTWFASAYDTDDVPYRLAVFVQLTGALILAAGVPQVFDEQNFTVITIGYVVMRLALVAQWLRAARSDTRRDKTAHRYAIGISLVQTGWVALLFAPETWLVAGFVVLAIAELAVPVWAERAAMTPWHPSHIAERYGLFTIIVLGESILSASLALQSATQAGDFNGELVPVIFGGLLIVLSMWWLYFERPELEHRSSLRTVFTWAYGHLLVFAAAAAVGSGLAVMVDWTTDHAAIGAVEAGAAVAVPVALYLLGLWVLHRPLSRDWSQTYLVPVVAVLVLLSPFFGQPVLLTGLLLVGLLVVKLATSQRAQAG